MTKLTENAFRDVNIAFANELSLVADTMGVDVWEVIRLANRHPRVNILSPGPGVGGHCIAVDPWFLVSAAPEQTPLRSEEHTSELQSLMRISYAVFCLKKKNNKTHQRTITTSRTYSTLNTH